ncbi:hypothetical protein GCM10025868_27570 [Angustibacter aerolatus]|uniref:Uncharacterized protein n=1 Tax=Angustibacter aerolatus TaxID=1162965 RepID=A0ABQ6JGZ9_9ACTN|nr:hypothetical protein [Angustibacter aerolatus]GMA87507.1 hypothetical protein GCM10025868_27570 [Angustibacter aerolatus]
MTDRPVDLADRLLRAAVADEQVAHRLAPHDDVEAVRAQVRRLAREQHVRIRTGLVDGALVVARADAAVWHESAERMRAKATPG